MAKRRRMSDLVVLGVGVLVTFNFSTKQYCNGYVMMMSSSSTRLLKPSSCDGTQHMMSSAKHQWGISSGGVLSTQRKALVPSCCHYTGRQSPLHASEGSDEGGKTKPDISNNNNNDNQAKPVEKSKKDQTYREKMEALSTQLRGFGQAGVLAYGMLNGVYYSVAFLLAWFGTSAGLPPPGAAGMTTSVLKATIQRFFKVITLVWAGSQVTKIFRASGAIVVAPLAGRILKQTQAKLGLKNQSQAFMLLVPLLLGSVLCLWASIVFGSSAVAGMTGKYAAACALGLGGFARGPCGLSSGGGSRGIMMSMDRSVSERDVERRKACNGRKVLSRGASAGAGDDLNVPLFQRIFARRTVRRSPTFRSNSTNGGGGNGDTVTCSCGSSDGDVSATVSAEGHRSNGDDVDDVAASDSEKVEVEVAVEDAVDGEGTSSDDIDAVKGPSPKKWPPLRKRTDREPVAVFYNKQQPTKRVYGGAPRDATGLKLPRPKEPPPPGGYVDADGKKISRTRWLDLNQPPNPNIHGWNVHPTFLYGLWTVSEAVLPEKPFDSMSKVKFLMKSRGGGAAATTISSSSSSSSSSSTGSEGAVQDTADSNMETEAIEPPPSVGTETQPNAHRPEPVDLVKEVLDHHHVGFVVLRSDGKLKSGPPEKGVKPKRWEFVPANRRIIFEVDVPERKLTLRYSLKLKRLPGRFTRAFGHVRCGPLAREATSSGPSPTTTTTITTITTSPSSNSTAALTSKDVSESTDPKITATVSEMTSSPLRSPPASKITITPSARARQWLKVAEVTMEKQFKPRSKDDDEGDDKGEGDEGDDDGKGKKRPLSPAYLKMLKRLRKKVRTARLAARDERRRQRKLQQASGDGDVAGNKGREDVLNDGKE